MSACNRLMTAKEKREILERELRERQRMEDIKLKEKQGYYKYLDKCRKQMFTACLTIEKKLAKEVSSDADADAEPDKKLQKLSGDSHKKRRKNDEKLNKNSDFIAEQNGSIINISEDIRNIFGYDRRRYKDESDMDLRNMESSFADVEREERISLKIGRKEDLQEQRKKLADKRQLPAKRELRGWAKKHCK